MKPSSQQEISILDTSLDLLDRLSTYVHKSVVFADDKFAEILHWHGGASMLLDFGAKSIKEFSSFENGEVDDHRATFFLSSAIIDVTLDVLRDVVTYSHFQHITIVTNIHPVMQALVEFKPPTEESASEVIASLEKWIMGLMREKIGSESACTCQLIYVPIVASPVLPNLFTLPTHSSLYPLLPTDVHLLMTRHKLTSQSELSFEHLPRQLQLNVKLLVSNLNSLSELLNLSEEMFAMGTTSNIVANELSILPWSRNRKKASNRKASLVLIDRTLDIGNVAHHSFESTLDRILNVLPRLPGHDIDVCVDMSSVSDVISNEDFACVAPGCLAHPVVHKYSLLLNTLALLKQKDITTELNRRLVEALEREELYEKTSQSGSLDAIQYYVSLFKNQPIAIKKHSPLLQLSLAVVQALRSKTNSFEQLTAVEKTILQSFQVDVDDDDDESRQDLSENMILRLLKEFKKSGGGNGDGGYRFSLEELLTLLLYLFALDEQKRWSLTSKEETLLERELVEAFMLAKASGNSQAAKLIETCRTEMDCLAVVQDLIDKFKGLSNSKSHLQKYRTAMEQGTVTSPASHRPIIKQVIQDILDPTKPDLVDISHKSSTFGDLIKTGFGFFRGSTRARPSDHPLVIIFVVGGVTMSEVKQVRDALTRSNSQTQVLIGGTTVLTPSDVLNLTLLQDNLCD